MKWGKMYYKIENWDYGMLTFSIPRHNWYNAALHQRFSQKCVFNVNFHNSKRVKLTKIKKK